MTQELLSGLNGYDIPCRHTIQGGESMVCLITHGFGSSKDSPTAQLLAGELPRHGIGTLALDLPAHGDSPVDGDALSIRHCLDDLARAEARALELAPGARVVYFSSSFGAYLNLIYLSTRPHRGTRSFLRSAAVEMPLLFHTPTPEQAEELAGLPHAGPGLRPPPEADPCLPGGSGCPRPLSTVPLRGGAGLYDPRG